MQTVLQILKQAGGWHHGLSLKIENPPYMALVIEATDESGPCGLPAISVTHYGEQNGDLMRDPEMCFELGMAGGEHLNPFYYRQDYLGIEQWSRTIHGGHSAGPVRGGRSSEGRWAAFSRQRSCGEHARHFCSVAQFDC
jgi:hypothetical protein